jgi:hypothetical protein
MNTFIFIYLFKEIFSFFYNNLIASIRVMVVVVVGINGMATFVKKKLGFIFIKIIRRTNSS